MSAYQFALDNVKTYIRSPENRASGARDVPTMNAFDAAQVLAVAFMKPQAEVMADLLLPAPRGDSKPAPPEKHRTSVLYSDLFHGVMYYFTSSDDLDRAKEVDMLTGLGINPLGDELDNRGIKWSYNADDLR